MLDFFHLFVKLKCPDLPATFKCQLTGEISDTWAFFQTNVAKQMIKEKYLLLIIENKKVKKRKKFKNFVYQF